MILVKTCFLNGAMLHSFGSLWNRILVGLGLLASIPKIDYHRLSLEGNRFVFAVITHDFFPVIIDRKYTHVKVGGHSIIISVDCNAYSGIQ